MVCPECKKPINSKIGICSCGYSAGKISISTGEDNPYTNEPCACGKRGRRIVIGKNSIVRCFYCYHQDQDKRYNHVDRKEYSAQELNYINKKNEFYHKPLFYGEEPNWDVFK
jgi:hypothetical protein